MNPAGVPRSQRGYPVDMIIGLPPDSKPACEGRYDLFDKAYGGSKRANDFRERLYDAFCRQCPVAHDCLELSMITNAQGTWAGTNRNYANGNRKSERMPIKKLRKKTDGEDEAGPS